MSLIWVQNLFIRLNSSPNFAMQVCEFIFTARFAQGTEDAENNNFSIAVDPR